MKTADRPATGFYLSQTKAQVMMMPYTNCVVKAHKVQTVKQHYTSTNLDLMSYVI